MLESLHLLNFQCHSDLLVELDPNVTSIVGPSDCGKSAVIRALRWAALNVPVGCMIRDGAKHVSVELIADGRRVVRTRGSENAYSLDGKEFRAFRTDVPDEIADVFRLSEINFQMQHDPIYWFASSSGEVSRRLNSIVDLGIIDEALSRTTSEVNRRKAVLETRVLRLEDAIREKNELKWVTEADSDYEEIEKLEAEGTEAGRSAAELESVCRSVKESAREVAVLKGIAEAADAVLDSAKAAGKVASELKKLEDLISLVRTTESKLVTDVPNLSEIDSLKKTAEEASAEAGRIESLIESVRSARSSLDSARSMLFAAEEDLNNRLDGICPLCGKEMD